MRILLFLFMLQTSVAFATPIKVEVDRKSVSLNESFQIVFSASEEPDESPDFSPLEKDFEIIDRNHRLSSIWTNGASNTVIQWTFDVIAKHAGNVVIPALRFGNETSPESSITVTTSSQPTDVGSNDAELFLEVEATPTQAFVQSQVLYTLRFFRRVNIAEATLKAPELSDAVVTKLDEDRTYKLQIKGVEYAVTERHYAIFPQKSGIIIIPPLTLTAAVLQDNQSAFGGFFGTRSTRTERVSSKAVTLKVLPVPQTFKGHWLAAEQVLLKQEWSGDVQNMKVGEPLTRTLTLTAKGTAVGELPKLYQASGSDDLKSYPDQPHLEEQKSPQGVIAIREEKIAFIPSKAGTYTLPALEISWFNVQTQQLEIAKIPSVTVAAIGAANTDEKNIVPSVENAVEKSEDKAELINSPKAINLTELSAKHYLWQGLAAFFGLGWLVTVVFLFKKKSGLEKVSPDLSQNIRQINEKEKIATLKQACTWNDASAAKKALISWGKDKYNVKTLGAIAEYCEARLRDEIIALNQILYGRQQSQIWDGKKLFQAFSEHRAMEKAKPKIDDKLEPLHRL